MTKQSETVEEIRAALDGTTERLATLEARRDDAATREEQARARRNAALMADAGSYRPELTAEVDTAAGERRAIEEAIDAARIEVAKIEGRLKEAETRQADDDLNRLKSEAIAAWETLDKEMMKLAPKILKLHDEALAAANAHTSTAIRLGNNWPSFPTPPGVEYAMQHARPYLSGEAAAEAERERVRRERANEAEELRARRRRQEEADLEAARKAALEALPEAERRSREEDTARYSLTVHPAA